MATVVFVTRFTRFSFSLQEDVNRGPDNLVNVDKLIQKRLGLSQDTGVDNSLNFSRRHKHLISDLRGRHEFPPNDKVLRGTRSTGTLETGRISPHTQSTTAVLA